MATATTNPTSDTPLTVDIKTFNETYRVYVKAGADGKIDAESVRLVTAGKDDNVWKKMDAPDSGYTKMLEQTVKVYEAGSVAGITQLIEDPQEAVNLFNRGVSQKTAQKLKGKLTELTTDGTSLVFDPTTEPYDTLEDLNEVTRRRNLSPADKASNALRQAVKAMFPGIEGDELEAKVQALFGGLQS